MLGHCLTTLGVQGTADGFSQIFVLFLGFCMIMGPNVIVIQYMLHRYTCLSFSYLLCLLHVYLWLSLHVIVLVLFYVIVLYVKNVAIYLHHAEGWLL